MTKVSLKGIWHSYDGGKTWAVKDINLEFESGKQYSLLGPSGCGKTTILKIICGLLSPTRGSVLFDDTDVTPLPPEKRNVAIVFQFPVVYRMSVLENLMFPLMNINIPREEKIRRAKEIADLWEITHILNEPAHRLGPADRQRIAIGRAIIRNTSLILLDEPMSSIEPDRRYDIKKLLLRIGKEFKRTMVFVTHDQTEALTFGEKIAVMSGDGRVLQFGTFDEIYHRPEHEFVGFFIGFPGMNIVKGIVEKPYINFGQFKLRLEKVELPLKSGEEVKMGIRPEHIDLSMERMENAFPFKVIYYEDLGRGRGILHLSNGPIFIKAVCEKEISIGSTVWVSFPEEHLIFFRNDGQRIL